MPIGGESVGTAYVRILAEGSGLDDSIRREFDDAEPAIRAAGEKHADAYADSFEEHMNEAPRRQQLRDSITDSLTRGKFLEEKFFGSNNWQEFRKSMGFRFGEAGRLAAKNLERELGEGMSFDQLKARLNNVTAEVAKATKQIQAEEHSAWQRMHQDALRMNADFDRGIRNMLDEANRMNREWNRKMQASLNEAYRLNTEFDRAIRHQQSERDLAFERSVRDNQRLVEGLRESFSDLSTEIERFARGEHTDLSRGHMIDSLTALRKGFHDSGLATREFRIDIDNMERRLRFANPTIVRTRGVIDRFATSMGTGFGRGSRNNFLNFIGSMVRNFLRLPSFALGAVDGLSDFVQFMQSKFTTAVEGGASTMQALGTTVAAASLSVVAGLAAIAAAAVALVLVIGPLSALISGLIAVITSLAATISFALVGALAVLVGLIPVAVAGIGVLVAGFLGLDDATKRALKIDLRPLITQFQGLAAAAGAAIFSNIENQVHRLIPVFRGLTPLVAGVGFAISRLGDYFIDAMHSVGFLQFQAAMTTFLPHAVESLGHSFGNFLGGMGGVFRALIPITREFLRWLERITGEFANWANSDKGQKQLKKFFRDAGDSLHSLWGLIKATGSLIGTLFDAGKDDGDSTVDKLAKKIRQFNEYLEAHPDALDKFFKNGQQVADDLGDIAVSIGKIADALDDDNTRDELHDLFTTLNVSLGPAVTGLFLASEGISKFVEGIRKLTEFRFSTITDFFGGLAGFGLQITGISDAWDRLKKTFGKGLGLPDSFKTFGTGAVQALLGNFSGIGAKIGAKLVGVGPAVGKKLQTIGTHARGSVRDLVSKFSGIPGKIADKFSSVGSTVRGKLRAAITSGQAAARDIVSKFTGIPGKIAGKFSAVGGSVKGKLRAAVDAAGAAVRDLVGKFSGIVGKIADKFSGVASSIRGRLNDAVSAAGSVAGNIVDAFRGLGGRIISAIGNITIHPHIDMPHIPIPKIGAAGFLTHGPQFSLIGEAGPEAVVPLDRPLSQVDPAVRMLSAIAQGKIPAMANGGVAGASKSIDMSGWQIVSPNTDTEAVAQQVANRAVAAMY